MKKCGTECFQRGCSARSANRTKVDVPQRGEVHKLWRELISGKLGRRFFHHLLQLLEGRAPRVVGEAQDGELDLCRTEGERQVYDKNDKKYCTTR